MRFQRVDCYNRLHRAITAAAHRQTSTATLPPQPSFLIVFIFAQLLFHVFCWLAMCGMGMTSSAPNKPLPHRKGVFFGFTLLDPSNLSTSLSTRPCLTYVYLFVYVCHCFWLHLKGFPFHTHTHTRIYIHTHLNARVSYSFAWGSAVAYILKCRQHINATDMNLSLGHQRQRCKQWSVATLPCIPHIHTQSTAVLRAYVGVLGECCVCPGKSLDCGK